MTLTYCKDILKGIFRVITSSNRYDGFLIFVSFLFMLDSLSGLLNKPRTTLKKGDLKARLILNLISQNILIKHRMKIEVRFPTTLRGGSYIGIAYA